jgi:hypothetical protein
MSSNDTNKGCVFFDCICFNDSTLDAVYDTSVSYIWSFIGKVRVENIKSISEP